MLFRKTISKFV